MTTSVAGATVETFENGLPSNYTLSGCAALVSGSSLNVYLTPTNDTSHYVSTGVGSASVNLAAGTTYFGFYWGSVGSSDLFTLTTSKGTENYNLASLTNLGFYADGMTSTYVNFRADAGTIFKSATFSGTQNSFKFDNVAAAAPEPGSIAMLTPGFLALGAGALRRRKIAASKV